MGAHATPPPPIHASVARAPEVPTKEHGRHAPLLFAPAAVEYVPAGQAAHVAFEVAPSAALNVPAGHGVDVVASGEQCDPAGHRASFWEPHGQKLPGEHATRVVALGQCEPAGHGCACTEPASGQ